MSVGLVEGQSPTFRVAPGWSKTYGDLAAGFASDYGLTPDPWQQLILDDWLAEDAGRWAALRCGLAIPRQNGKNAVLEVRELFGAVGLGERILHTAHEVKTAQKHFKRLKHFFGTRRDDPAAKYPQLNEKVADVRNVNGQEAVLLKNGGSIEIIARSKSSGRGFTVDVLVMDEAQELEDDAMEALLPTTASAPLGNPQWIFTGTPPGPRARGEVFTRMRGEAHSGGAGQVWHEWSSEAGADLDDVSLTRRLNPALVTGRLQWPVVEGERRALSDDGFARERFGQWATSSTSRVVSEDAWSLVADQGSVAVDRLALAVDVAPDLTTASVGLAGVRSDGLWHVELVENRRGADWVPGFVADLLGKNPQVRALVVDVGSPAKAVVDDLVKLKLKLTLPRVADVGAACARFVEGVRLGQLRHTDQVQLAVALSVARKRVLGATDMWAWNRKNAESDITPLVAVTLALWGAQNSTVERPMKTQGKKGMMVL